MPPNTPSGGPQAERQEGRRTPNAVHGQPEGRDQSMMKTPRAVHRGGQTPKQGRGKRDPERKAAGR
eukprot:9721121-Alexandrium_andersonii.AAC.1